MADLDTQAQTDDIFEIASLWITRLDRTLSDDEQSELGAWLQAHKSHACAFEEMAELWDKTESLSSLSNLFPIAKIKKNKTTQVKKKWAPLLLSSVAVCLLSLAFYHSHIGPTMNTVTQHIQTTTRILAPTHLPDESLLQLNTHSSVTLTFTPSLRRIHLSKGELHITVKHDAARPLLVSTENTVIRAVGTAFNVQANATNTSLIVTEGQVIAGTPENLEEIQNASTSNSPFTRVSSGQKAKLSRAEVTTEQIDPTELRVALAWKHEKIIFTGETLDKALAEISRYTDKHFVLDNDSLKAVRISGIYSTSDIDALLSSLAHNFGIESKIIAGNTIHLKKTDPIKRRSVAP